LPPDVRFLGQNAPKCLSAGATSQIPPGELPRAPQTPSSILGDLLLREEGRGVEGREEEGRVKEGTGPPAPPLHPQPLHSR